MQTVTRQVRHTMSTETMAAYVHDLDTRFEEASRHHSGISPRHESPRKRRGDTVRRPQVQPTGEA